MRRKATPADVVRATCLVAHVEYEDMTTRIRPEYAVRARRACAYVAYVAFGMPSTHIAEAMRSPNHSTALTRIAAAKRILEDGDESFASLIARIEHRVRVLTGEIDEKRGVA